MSVRPEFDQARLGRNFSAASQFRTLLSVRIVHCNDVVAEATGGRFREIDVVILPLVCFLYPERLLHA
jgi:hypothetical protein